MSGLEMPHSRGEELARRFEAEGSTAIPLEDPRVQVFLAKLAYRNSENPMEKWLTGDEKTNTPPLSSPFRAYSEERKATGEHPTIDVTDETALSELLEAVRKHAPKTLH